MLPTVIVETERVSPDNDINMITLIFEREHKGYGFGQQNPEGESIISFA